MMLKNRFLLLLVIVLSDLVLGDWSCYDIEGAIAGISHNCYCEASHCNEQACVNDGGVWTESCKSCHCDGNAGGTDTSITGDGCYDQDINTCVCDPSVCSEETCQASGGSWADSCRSCQCTGTGQPTGGAFCFSELAMVEVLEKNAETATAVAMKELQVGDMVKTAPGRYQPVYAFGHFHETKLTEFLQIHTDAAKVPLEISGSHFIYIAGKKSPVRADSLRVGDVVHYSDAANNSSSEGAVVTNISKAARRGIYAPLTSDGTVYVDGIKASTYAIISSKSSADYVEVAGWSFFGLSEADAIHLALSPLRFMCRGSISDICKELDEETKMNVYVAWGTRSIHYIEGQNTILQFILAIMAISIFALIWTFEKLSGFDSFSIASISLLGVAAHHSLSSKNLKNF